MLRLIFTCIALNAFLRDGGYKRGIKWCAQHAVWAGNATAHFFRHDRKQKWTDE